MITLTVLYPQPTDVDQFDKDYAAHIDLLHEKAGIPRDVVPYTITKFFPSPTGAAPFYQMFSMPFNSLEELQATMASEAMGIVAADAIRVSTGGAPAFLVGNQQ